MAKTKRMSALADGLACARRAEMTVRTEARRHLAQLQDAEESLVAAGFGQAEAMLHASRNWAAACQALTRAMTATAKAQHGSVASEWTIRSGIEAQVALVQTSVDGVLSRVAKLDGGLRER